MLRQASYWDYYKDKAGPWRDSPQTLRYHLDHCIDNLRQKVGFLKGLDFDRTVGIDKL